MTPFTQLGLAFAAAALGLMSALTMIGEVRLVNILILFFGGFGAGAGLVAAVRGFRAARLRADAAADTAAAAPVTTADTQLTTDEQRTD
jgi:hypothetical protein